MKQLLHCASEGALARLALCALLLVSVGLGGCKASKSSSLTYTLGGQPCLDGTTACGDECVRLESNAAHCGACGSSCVDGSICDRGACVAAAAGCSLGLTLCGGGCVDATNDEQNCGTCGQSCAPEGACSAGSCTCPGALTPCGSTCADLASDALNCGACGIACVDVQTCQGGSCECPGGTELCTQQVAVGEPTAACVDTQTNSAHCGACGTVCTGGQVCALGSCDCPGSTVLCAGACADTQTSTEHCGACGTACADGQVCELGACVCPDGTELCGDGCIDTQSDEANCGSCGTACGLGEGCVAGDCTGGALGEDGCSGLAGDLSITQVAAYQTVKTELARDGAAVEDPAVRLIAGRTTLVRVFVAPGAGWTPRELSARLHIDTGVEAATDTTDDTATGAGDDPASDTVTSIVTHYSDKLTVSAASTEQNRGTTFEFVVPKDDVTADARYAVEIVECTAASGAALRPRFPDTGGAVLGAVAAGGLRIHIVPLRANGRLPDTSQATLDAIYGRSFLASFPISDVEFSVGEPFDIANPQDWSNNLDAVRALRQQEQPPADVYYYGMMQPSQTLGEFCGGGCTAGIGYVPGGQRLNPQTRAAMGLAYANNGSAFTMLHEVAHNHGRNHSPCVQGGTISGVDGNYPYDGGLIGVFGYDERQDELIAPDGATDLMGYCRNQWLSDYTYNGLINTVVAVNQAQQSVIVSPERLGSWHVMLVDPSFGTRWGRRIAGPVEAFGTEESAVVLDAGGAVIEPVSVYRTEVSDIGAFSIQVPEPEPGWHSIQVAGAPALAYPAP